MYAWITTATSIVSLGVLAILWLKRKLCLREFARMDQENKSLAHQLADYLAATRSEISYYEDQAANNGLPLYDGPAKIRRVSDRGELFT